MLFDLGITLTKKQETDLIRYIRDEIVKQMYQRVMAAVDQLYKVVRDYIRKQIPAAPEMYAIVETSLRWDLGLTPEEGPIVAQKIVDILIQDLKIYARKETDAIVITLTLLPRDYQSILSIGEGHFTSVNAKGVTHLIPWLEWLLLRGHEQVVREYHVRHVGYSESSRSKYAFMVKGGSYSIIPSQYTGTELDNFITRALDDIGVVLQNELDIILS